MPVPRFAKRDVLEKRIRSVEREIREIEDEFYSGQDIDLENRLFLLKVKRDLTVRGIVMELHLALDDLLNVWIGSFLCRSRGRQLQRIWKRRRGLARGVDELIEGERSIGFRHKVVLLKAAGLLNNPLYKKLLELNRLRNRCSHSWLLDYVIRKGVKRGKPKKHLLEFRGRNLYQVAVMKDFIREYSTLYYHPYLRVYA